MQKHYIKGQRLLSYGEAVELSESKVPKGAGFIRFGDVLFPASAKYNGFFIQGQMKSGKSATISLLMEQAFRGMQNTPVRGVVYDPKNKATNVLCALGVPFERLRIMNPMDKRCYGWDIQKDVTNQLIARGLSRVFIKDRGDSDRFWTEAPRGLMSSVMVSFILSKLEREDANKKLRRGETPLKAFEWTLLDVANALSDIDHLREVLNKHEDTKPAIRFLDKDKEDGDIIASLEADFAPLRFFASRWADRPLISFSDWKNDKEGKVLVFGSEREASEIDDLNRMMIQRITQIVTRELKPPSTEEKQDIWFFFDEFSKLGRIPDFNDFSTLVREYGGCVVISVQNIEQMKADDCYGEHLAQVIVDDLGTKIFLSCEGKAAQFASDTIGTFEEFSEGDSEQVSSGQGFSIGTSRQKRVANVVLPSEFYQLPALDERGVMKGFCMSAALERYAWEFTLTKEHGLQNIWNRKSKVTEYEREEDPRAFRFKTWTPEQKAELGITGEKEEKSKKSPNGDLMSDVLARMRAGKPLSVEEMEEALQEEEKNSPGGSKQRR